MSQDRSAMQQPGVPTIIRCAMCRPPSTASVQSARLLLWGSRPLALLHRNYSAKIENGTACFATVVSRVDARSDACFSYCNTQHETFPDSK